jgi:hypothetical protein
MSYADSRGTFLQFQASCWGFWLDMGNENNKHDIAKRNSWLLLNSPRVFELFFILRTSPYDVKFSEASR